jgi:hypothetical protein
MTTSRADCPCGNPAPIIDVLEAPLDEAMRIAHEQMTKWKKTLDWLAER